MPKTNRELTTTNQEAWQAIQKFNDKHGVLPSVRQLAEVLGVSHNAAHYQMGQLRDKGYLGERRVTETRLMLTAKGRKPK